MLEREQAPVPHLVAQFELVESVPVDPRAVTVAFRQTPRKVDQVDVLVLWPAYVGQLDTDRRDKLSGITRPGGAVQRRTEQFNLNARLFTDHAPRRIDREFVWINVSTGRQPAAEPGMPVEKDPAAAHDKDSDREVARGVHVRMRRNRARIRRTVAR